MRKLQKAAVVATMIGSVSMFGAGAASACGYGGHESTPPVTQSVICNQSNGDTTSGDVSGLINLGDVSLGGSGDATINQNQQICGIGNSNNTQTAGNATSGAGGAGTIGVSVGL